MHDREQLRAALQEAIVGAGSPLSAATRLCSACVELLEVDNACISLVRAGASQGTFGASSAMSQRLDDYQFTFGEGPCLDAVRDNRPVLASDLAQPEDVRWPAFRAAALAEGICAVFALPVSVAATPVGALHLSRRSPGALSPTALDVGTWAAQLAASPLLGLMTLDVVRDAARSGDGTVAADSSDGEALGDDALDDAADWDQLASLRRVEIYQATGMIMGALNVTSAEALVRLRAYAYTQQMTAKDVAVMIVSRQLLPQTDDWWRGLVAEDELG